jgi:hypothetical protein
MEYSRYAPYVIRVITRVKGDASGTRGTLHRVIPIRDRRPTASGAPVLCPPGPQPAAYPRGSPVVPATEPRDGTARPPAGSRRRYGQHPR